MMEASTKRCTRSGLLATRSLAGLDQGRVAVEALVGEQKDLWLKSRLLLDRIRLRRDVALHGTAPVREERLRVRRVGLHLRFAESEIGLEPLEIAGEPLLGNKQRELLEILEFLDPLIRMRHQHLGILLEHGRDGKGGNILRDRIEALQRVGAHVEVELAHGQQDAIVHIRAAGHDGDIEPVVAIGAVGERLIEPAVLGLRQPVGTERDLVERLRAGRGEGKRQNQTNAV